MKKLWGNPFNKLTKEVENNIDFLSSVPIFDSLSRRQKEKINSFIHVRRYEIDEIVFRQGDPGVGLYILREGEVSVFSENIKDMTKTCITKLAKGDFFGEIALLIITPAFFIRVRIRTTFIAPPVEPPQAPMNIKAKSTILAPELHKPKLEVTKPVPVMIEIAWKSPYLYEPRPSEKTNSEAATAKIIK